MKKIFYKLSALSILLLTIIFFFSTKEFRYECNGRLESNNIASQKILYFKLVEYRWWVHLWNDSDGIVNAEIPGKNLEYFSELKEVGDQIQIYKRKGSLIGGYYSKLSNHIGLDGDFGNFEGKCKLIN